MRLSAGLAGIMPTAFARPILEVGWVSIGVLQALMLPVRRFISPSVNETSG
ncbi:MAG TPA: hypothetical protein VFS61_05750 [Anaerolineales bacterium]|nr:hypothetical protein [Anaerolineales bacterium]